ncbi:Ig-like domain-containing protein [Streptomyces sp. NPDC053720]|uniref:Ig-like domain-containing protein n=1 Tax=Streptomyces sp. NPDC053720 TaxID=3154855 RepID=UPI0034221C6F
MSTFEDQHTVDLTTRKFAPVYKNGEMRLPKKLPDYLSFSRPADGATGYTSSDESVATVDAQGKVTILRNGKTTVTAQTTAGTKSYELTVTGIRGLEILSNQAVTWQNAKNLADQLGLDLPGQLDFETIVNLYGAELASVLTPPNAPVWGELLGADTAWTLDPVTLAVTAESTGPNNLRQVAGIG